MQCLVGGAGRLAGAGPGGHCWVFGNLRQGRHQSPLPAAGRGQACGCTSAGQRELGAGLQSHQHRPPAGQLEGSVWGQEGDAGPRCSDLLSLARLRGHVSAQPMNAGVPAGGRSRRLWMRRGEVPRAPREEARHQRETLQGAWPGRRGPRGTSGVTGMSRTGRRPSGFSKVTVTRQVQPWRRPVEPLRWVGET